MANDRHSYVRFFPSDWVGGTARLPRLHRSVYFDICCFIWDTGHAVPEHELKMMLSDIEGWPEIISDLLLSNKIERLDCGSISNPKAITEAERAYSSWKKMSDAGKGVRKGVDKGLTNNVGKDVPKEDDKVDGAGLPQNQNQNHTSPNGEGIGAKRAKKLPDDFEPILTDKAQANANRLGSSYENELQQFKDHHTAKGSTMKDWQAAFRTWLANAVKYRDNRGGGKKSGWIE